MQGKPVPNIEDECSSPAHVQGWSRLAILVHACSVPQNHTYAGIAARFYVHHVVLQCDVGELVQGAGVGRSSLGWEELCFGTLVYHGVDDEQLGVESESRLVKQDVCGYVALVGQVLGRVDTEPCEPRLHYP